MKIALDKLKEYQRLEEQGLLLELPCKIGDTVYSITRDFISEYTVEGLRIFKNSIQYYWKCTKGIYHNVTGFADFEIGKTVFLSEQQAKEALEKMKGRYLVILTAERKVETILISKNKICNTCKNKKGRVLTAPISKKKYPCFSCKNYPLSQGYNYEKNTCTNYEMEN